MALTAGATAPTAVAITSDSGKPSLGEFAPHVVRKRVVAATTTLSWVAFIPQARIDAPPVGCSYGRGYQFAGDGHTAFDWRSSRYRTAAHAVIDWKAKKVAGNVSVRASHVYKKSAGKLVATKTASAKNMSVRALGFGSNYVDIRMVNHASNPFCLAGAIDGAISIRLYTDGYWIVRSGNFRKTPNHYIYVYNGGKVSNLVTQKYQNALCLLGAAACDLVTLTGVSGHFK